jgi:hypothetical protein
MIELHIKLLFCDAFFRDALAFAMHLLSPTAGEARKPTIRSRKPTVHFDELICTIFRALRALCSA